MNRGITGPDLCRNGVSNRAAVTYNIIEPALARVILTYRVCANKTGTLALCHFIVCSSEPKDAIISSTRNIGVTGSHPVNIFLVHFQLHFIFRLIRRITDNHIKFRPITEKRVITNDKIVQTFQWQSLIKIEVKH